MFGCSDVQYVPYVYGGIHLYLTFCLTFADSPVDLVITNAMLQVR